MNRKLQKTAMLLFAVIFPLLLGGCSYQLPLSERQLVRGIGIDYQEGRYHATMQISAVKEDGGDEVLVFQADGDSARDALSHVAMTEGRRPLFSHGVVVLFGRAMAEEGLEEALDFFVRYPESDVKLQALMADGTAEEILTAKMDGAPVRAKEIGSLVDSRQYNGLAAPVSVVRLVNQLSMQGSDAFLPVARIEGEGVTVDGTAIFSGGKLKTVIDEPLTRGFLLASGRFAYGTEVLEIPELGRVTFELSDVKTRVTPELAEGKPRFRIKVTCNAYISALDVPYRQTVGQEFLPVMTEGLEKELREQCVDAIHECAVVNGCDVFNLGRRLFQAYPEYWKAHGGEWKKMLSALDYEVEVASNIRYSGKEITPGR